MSKPDKYGDTLRRDSRDEFAQTKARGPEGSTRDGFDDLESSEELLGGHTGVGKEIKLGLAVIVLLLIVLGVVVVRRLMRPSAEIASDGPEAAKATDTPSPGAKRAASPPPSPGAGKSFGTPAFPGTGPGAKKASLDPDWTFASDRDKDLRADPRTRPGPPAAPRESGAGSPGRFGGFDNDPGTRAKAGSWQGDASTGSPAELRTIDPFKGRPPAGEPAGSFGGPRTPSSDWPPPKVGGISGREPSPPTQPWDSPPGAALEAPRRTFGPGASAEVPGIRGGPAVRTDASGERTYVVQEGDTIYDIARSELGSATRWTEIYQLNRDALGRQPSYITPGMRLVLPQDSGSPGVLTRRPGSGFMR